MGPKRIALVVVALIAAVGVAFLVHRMVGGGQSEATPVATQTQEPMARVLVAKRDLAVGTQLVLEDMAWQAWPASSLNAAFITDGAAPAAAPVTPAEKVEAAATHTAQNLTGGPAAREALVGATVRERILAGEPLMGDKIVRGGEGGYMSVVLQPGMRALAIPVNVETAAGGFVLPGDRVDVVQSREIDKMRVTDVILRNVRVLAIDQKTSPDKDTQAIVGGVATIEVPVSAVNGLVKASGMGPLHLALRSYADMGGMPSGSSGADETVAEAQPAVVRVYRNGALTEVNVQR